MWLINTTTHRLRHFMQMEIPDYGILSHVWADEEVSFANMRDCGLIDDSLSLTSREEEERFPVFSEMRRYRTEKLKSMKGWGKIERFCGVSRADDLEWAWIDTACIDKSSSAELQEAINSMFNWYSLAARCFVYMYDVTATHTTSPLLRKDQFCASIWFTRGWTLQELLAPCIGRTRFLNCAWSYIGLDTDLVEEISSASNIPSYYFRACGVLPVRIASIREFSVAERMSWAANRRVTREEDVAYSLLGIFGVNMPLLYGEGKRKAFRRLQRQIIQQSPDETIFAWNSEDSVFIHNHTGLLAQSPKDFVRSGKYMRQDITSFMGRDLRGSGVRGLNIQTTPLGCMLETFILRRNSAKALPEELRALGTWTTDYALPLQCQVRESDDFKTVFLQLNLRAGNEYVRKGPLIYSRLDWQELVRQQALERIFISSSIFHFPEGLRTDFY